jgi:hypothetical protein
MFESSVYLMICMPTIFLHNKSPFECIFHHTSNYNFVRTFECLFYSFLRSYHTYKLDFCFSPYVFLGYSSYHLGYYCLDITSQCIYNFHHVYFYEQVFSFDKSR